MAIHLTIEDHFIPYLVLAFNSMFFHCLRILSYRLIPSIFNLTLQEIISTIELCSCCAELTPVWNLHGNFGLALTLFILCCWWWQSWTEAEACPCRPVEEFLIMKRIGSMDLWQKLLGQLIGASMAWKYATWIWCWHLTEDHHKLHEAPCEASLYVTPLYGACIEGLITFISRIIGLQSENWNHYAATVVNSAASVALVLFAMNTTGGFFNPILASALMIGCKGHTYWEHFQVYWIGSLFGSLLARWLHYHLLLDEEAKKIKSE